MKSLFITLVSMTITASADATSVVRADKSFEQIITSADHVVVGKVIGVSMRDKKGKKVQDPKAHTGPHSGNVISIRVTVEEGGILKTHAKDFPRAVSYVLWPSLILDLAAMKELEGQSFIILLDGDHFQPHGVAPFDFMWPLDWRERVVSVIAAEKKRQN